MERSRAIVLSFVRHVSGGVDSGRASSAEQAALVAAEQKVHDLVMQHASWVQGTANTLIGEDALAFIAKSGFPQARVGHRTAVTSPTVTNTELEGVAHFELPRVEGGILNACEISTDGINWIRAIDTEHLKGDVTGIPRGQLTYFRFRTFARGRGYTSWSQVISLIVT